VNPHLSAALVQARMDDIARKAAAHHHEDVEPKWGVMTTHEVQRGRVIASLLRSERREERRERRWA
jgi:hypothetical protein